MTRGPMDQASRPRGRGRGRPSRMDILRRQALDEAREIAPAVVALLLDLDERPRRLALAAAPRVRVAVTSEIPTALMRALGQPLLATPSHPLAKHVIEYADAVRSLADDERGNDTARFGKDCWSPDHNVCHSSSVRGQRQRLIKDWASCDGRSDAYRRLQSWQKGSFTHRPSLRLAS